MSLRQQKKARARSHIVGVATQLFNQQGISATTTRQIAADAGISYQTLYNYFPSKTQIVQAIIAADITRWGLEVDAVIKQYNGNLLQTLADISQTGFDQINSENVELWREMAVGLFGQNFDESSFITLNQAVHERYYALLRMSQGMGHLQSDTDLHLLAHTLFCLTDYALLLFFLNPNQDKQAALQTLKDQIALLINPYTTRITAQQSF